MFVFGCAVTNRAVFEEIAFPGIERASEDDSLLLTREGFGSIQQPYNEMLDEASSIDGLEALVLVHQDLELLDSTLTSRVRPLLRQPDIGVIGSYGGRNVPFHHWTDCAEKFGRAMATMFEAVFSAGSHQVDVVDGSLLVIAPWVARTIEFNETLAEDFHGYDVDFCMRVVSRGGRVVCNDIPYLHHMERPWSDADQLRRAGYRMARMWDPDLRPEEWAPSFEY